MDGVSPWKWTVGAVETIASTEKIKGAKQRKNAAEGRPHLKTSQRAMTDGIWTFSGYSSFHNFPTTRSDPPL